VPSHLELIGVGLLDLRSTAFSSSRGVPRSSCAPHEDYRAAPTQGKPAGLGPAPGVAYHSVRPAARFHRRAGLQSRGHGLTSLGIGAPSARASALACLRHSGYRRSFARGAFFRRTSVLVSFAHPSVVSASSCRKKGRVSRLGQAPKGTQIWVSGAGTRVFFTLLCAFRAGCLAQDHGRGDYCICSVSSPPGRKAGSALEARMFAHCSCCCARMRGGRDRAPKEQADDRTRFLRVRHQRTRRR